MWDWIKDVLGLSDRECSLDEYEQIKDCMDQDERDEYLTCCGLDPHDPDNYDDC